MKKFTILFTAVLLISVVKAQLPFSDGFDSGNFTSGGWNVSGNATISSQSPAQGNYCVKGAGTYTLEKDFATINDQIVTVEYKMKASQTNKNCVTFRIRDSYNNISADVYFRWLGAIYAYDGSQEVSLLNYSSDTWYNIKVVVDYGKRTYDVYINGNLKADDFSFEHGSFTKPEKFIWNSGESSGTGWVDEVEINGDNIPPSGLPFTDCFESGNFTSGGWNVSGNATISSQSPAQGNYCVKGAGTYTLEKDFATINDQIVTVEYKMKASQTNKNCVTFRIRDSYNNISADVYFRWLGAIYAYDGSQEVSLLNYSSDTWYNIKVVIDYGNRTYDVYINGNLKADDFSFEHGSFTKPEKFIWNSGESSGTGWVDCVNIYPGTTGIVDNGSIAFNVYPNPTSQFINITSSENTAANISITNLNGIVLLKKRVESINNCKIDLTALKKGLYVLRVKTNKNVFLRTIIKE